MTGKRTQKRSRSGAASACPHCGKKLRGDKGLVAHVATTHPQAAAKKGGAS